MNRTAILLAAALATGLGVRAQTIAAGAQTTAARAPSSGLFPGLPGRIHVVAPIVLPVAGLRDRVRDGQLHLRLADYLTLVLANNTQVHIVQLANATAQYGVLSALSPFDPNLSLGFNSSRSVQTQYSQINGAPTLSSLGQVGSLNYSQQFVDGQTVQLNFGSDRNSSNSQFNTFNPSISADLNFSVTQPLLRNRGNLQNRTPLLLAKAQLLVVGDQTQTQIADQLVSAADQYWETVQARDQITVQQQALDLAQQSYARDQHALELGALAPGDIFTSQAQVAADQVQLLQAQSNYRQQLDLLKREIGADLDPSLAAVQIMLDDDPASTVPQLPPMPVEDAVTFALGRRPEMAVARRQLSEDQLSLAQAHDALRPQLDLTGSYGSNGLGGDAIPVTNSLGASTGGASGGLGDALHQLFAFGFPTYGFNLQLTLPVRNSAGEAQLANTLVSQTNHAYAERNEVQQVTQDVRVADTQLSMAVAVVKSATTARDLSQKNVDAEQQKYQLGSITVFELLQAQVQLSNAQATLLGAYTSYQVALIAYERATWTLLDHLHLQFGTM